MVDLGAVSYLTQVIGWAYRSDMNISLDYPAIDGRPVTEAHARICREEGHTTYVRDGVDMGTCPRCGAVTTHP